MKSYLVSENYTVCYPNPIVLKKGDSVKIEISACDYVVGFPTKNFFSPNRGIRNWGD